MARLPDSTRAQLNALRAGKPQELKGAVCVPLTGTGAGPQLCSLTKALRLGTLTVTELDGGARVPELEARNDGDLPVLIVPGAELLGGLQNRVVNAPVVIMPACTLRVPVSCIEQGRWSPRQREGGFSSKGRSVPPTLRYGLYRSSGASLAKRRNRRSDQGLIWEEVQREARRRGVGSRTSALSDVLDATDGHDDAEVPWEPLGDQLGVVVVSPEHVGLDLFSTTSSFEEHGRASIQAYARSAEDGAVATLPEEAGTRAEALLRSLVDAAWTQHAGVGAGVELRARVGTAEVVALTLNDTLVYLSAVTAPRAGRQL